MSNVDEVINSAFIGKVLLELIRDKSYVRECMNEIDVGLSRSALNRVSIRAVVAGLEKVASELVGKEEEEEEESEDSEGEEEDEGEEDEGEEDEGEEDEETWYCHRKYHGMNENCKTCMRWYCNCVCDDEEDAIHENSANLCEKCCKINPAMSSSQVEKKGNEPDAQDDEHDSEDSEQARLDEDGEYIPRVYTWYMGVVPENVTRSQLVTVMATGLSRFLLDEKLWTKKNANSLRRLGKELIPAWLRWFSEDQVFLVSKEDEKQFIKDVLNEFSQEKK
jgi:hypothetical protein